ncbi:hypothetical protein BC831DRAFT_514055 [Entophlyctis helioformis]|nr:hypothetical protein BC831DRAFT_514055 [Entophlyctis helioformis]
MSATTDATGMGASIATTDAISVSETTLRADAAEYVVTTSWSESIFAPTPVSITTQAPADGFPAVDNDASQLFGPMPAFTFPASPTITSALPVSTGDSESSQSIATNSSGNSSPSWGVVAGVGGATVVMAGVMMFRRQRVVNLRRRAVHPSNVDLSDDAYVGAFLTVQD